MNLLIESDARGVVGRLEGASGFLRGEITQRFRRVGQSLRNELRAELPRRTGRARRAVFSKLERRQRQSDVTVIVGANLAKAPHLAVLEHGALIRPRRGQFLTVPIGSSVSRRGVTRFSARDLQANPEAFGYAKSFVAKDVIFGERASGRLVPLFALVKQVLITRRSYFKNKARQRRPQIMAAVREAVRAGLKAAWGSRRT